MGTKPVYTQEMIDEFVETAQLTGISPAIKRLGYPSFPTAQKWFRDKGLGMPNIDSLMAKAAELKVFYGDSEKKYAIQSVMDAIVEKVQENDLDADSLNKLANGLTKLIQAFQLVEGKSTSITESHTKDATDLAVYDLLGKVNAQNKLKVDNLP
jgi:hypothetical protein